MTGFPKDVTPLRDLGRLIWATKGSALESAFADSVGGRRFAGFVPFPYRKAGQVYGRPAIRRGEQRPRMASGA